MMFDRDELETMRALLSARVFEIEKVWGDMKYADVPKIIRVEDIKLCRLYAKVKEELEDIYNEER